MKTQQVTIDRLVQVNNEICLHIILQSTTIAGPGQYFQVCDAGDDLLLPTVLHACRVEGNSVLLCGEILRHWLPGTELHLRGPRGKGFHLPPLAKKVALTTLDRSSLNPLMPVADLALQMGAEVTLLTNRPLTDLPAEIEVLSLDDLETVKDWADYIAAVSTYENLPALQRKMAVSSGNTLLVEVLVDTPMICAEGSACGACAVQTHKGWRLVCKDGPVFRLDDLALEGGAHG